MEINVSKSSYRWFVFVICWTAGIFAGCNSNLFAVMLPQAIKDISHFHNLTAINQLGSYVLFSFLMGWMSGGLLIGKINDRYGRMKGMAISIFLYVFFTAAAGLSQTIWQLAVCRFLTGMGVGGTMLSISIFLAESWSTSSRALAVGALITSYQVGVFLSGIIPQMVSEWRVAFYFGLSPIILVPLVWGCFREPKQWIQNKQNKDEIQSTLIKRNMWIGSFVFGSLLIGYWASLFWIPTWIQNLLGPLANGNEKNIATTWHGLGAIVGCMSAGHLANLFGRRPVVALSYGGAFIISWWMFTMCETFTSAIYYYNALLGMWIGIAQAVMYIYLAELFPTQIRAFCVGFCLNIGRLITAIAVLFIGPLTWLFGGFTEALCAFASLYLLGAGFIYLGPETNKQELPI